MRFMVLVKVAKEMGPGSMPTAEQFAAMQAYNEKLVKDGILLAAEGLAPASKGARLKFSNGQCDVFDGPFAETKELIAGFSIIKVNSLQAAIELVKAAPNFAPGGEAEIEIRKLMDVEDFGDEFTPNEEIAKVKYE